MTKPMIGILTWHEGTRFAEPSFFRRMIRAGKELGCVVYLFGPQDVLASQRKVRGYTFQQGTGWTRQTYRLPDVVIDRFRFSRTHRFREYVKLRKQNTFLYANNRLANKWKVHQVLERNPIMCQWLPETRLYSQRNLRMMLDKYRRVYVKPANGTGGRGILRIDRQGAVFRMLGRDQQRHKVSGSKRNSAALAKWLDNWVKRDKYVIQQGLFLELIPKRAIDLRLLIQKDRQGAWSVTGCGIRVGTSNSATSNLHGGGTAASAQPFLEQRFGHDKTAAILQDCNQLAYQTALTLEQHYGQMLELGLDIGIDTTGQVWLIEVNPKPGREIFREMGDWQRYREAIRRPLEYALFLSGSKRIASKA
ncbi:YheC/YheD family protein [Brevibacillus fulvus]|uniref:Glutathione synthase/RimK-type ligase-like ATP-grasp enzyme n=1 Tax=Brevibacillus fulvus TaxID=1125967 RepID=A0A938XVL5_9BACL|nr:YheC/YheD family protein [Brevibacillus fulvus]MBM7588776.1 glutathione synthase/RimK-type ligase-like ATP-grasp enzyme [Brevibacillus fulvus]